MSAHNAATEAYARKRTQFVIDALKASHSQAARLWAERLEAALTLPVGGTLKAFMSEHNGKAVDTIQSLVHLNGAEPSEISGVWAPGIRTVNATRSTYVELGGSRRDYAGVTTLTSGEGTYLGFAKFGDDAVQLVFYTAV